MVTMLKIWLLAATALSPAHCSLSAANDKLDIPLATREYWMQQTIDIAVSERDTPCPDQPFTSVVVNHTADAGPGRLVCSGVNAIADGDPTAHGEMVTIRNCTAVLTDPKGDYRLSGEEALQAFRDLSLYTNGEACAMCATAIRWSGFREYIYATTFQTLRALNWGAPDIESAYVFNHSSRLEAKTVLVGPVLEDKTDRLYAWQYDPSGSCPAGCSRDRAGTCLADKHHFAHGEM